MYVAKRDLLNVLSVSSRYILIMVTYEKKKMQQYWRGEVDKHGGKVVNHVIGNSVYPLYISCTQVGLYFLYTGIAVTTLCRCDMLDCISCGTRARWHK